MTDVIEGFKKDPKYEHWRLRIFGITWLAYAGFYLTRASFSVAKIGILADPSVSLTTENMRSEERRVGKECRSRWSPYH